MAIIHSNTALLFLAALLAGGGREDNNGSSSSSSFYATAFLAAPATTTTIRCSSKQQRSSRCSSIAAATTPSESGIAAPSPSSFSSYFRDQPQGIDATSNEPPDLRLVLDALRSLKSGSDVRGTFVDHRPHGTIADLWRPLRTHYAREGDGGGAALTPFAAHCLGAAFATRLLSKEKEEEEKGEQKDVRRRRPLTICIGRDPRPHGERLADAFARGASSIDCGDDDHRGGSVRTLYASLATTPSMYEFVRADMCDAAVMITASHLPDEKNGMKFFARGAGGGLGAEDIDGMIDLAQCEARGWYDMGILPPSSGNAGVMCSESVGFMPYYEDTLKRAILRELPSSSSSTSTSEPLAGLKIVVNPGNGAGCFFAKLLGEMGADVSGSIHLTPDGTFPKSFGVPNPEKREMVDETKRACERCSADVGIMFDTDADRSGFVLPRTVDPSTGVPSDHEALNGNRMIALVGKMFSESSPGCAIVTDSTTSEALGEYLERSLGLEHVRHVRGYANVIGEARRITEEGGGAACAEAAIEISGHCAMRENGYVDDGTYTAVKVIGLLARAKDGSGGGGGGSLLDSISDLKEMPYEEEVRFRATDGSLDTTARVFEQLGRSLKEMCEDGRAEDWSLDEENREGVRLRLASGGHFMIRKSLHDPVISMQVESVSREEARAKVLEPLLGLLSEHDSVLDYSALENA